MDTATTCSICGLLPDSYLAQTGYGDAFPENAYKLEKLNFSFSRDMWRCPECGDLFDWEDIPQYYGSGNLDEERLARLHPSQADLIRLLLDLQLNGRAPADVLEQAFKEVPEDLVRQVLQHQAIMRREDFEPFVAPLVQRIIQGSGIDLADVISSYCSYCNRSLQQVCDWLNAADQPLNPGSQFLLNRCKDRLPKYPAASTGS